MRFFNTDIIKFARDNQDFRRVVFTSMNSQVVVMSLTPGEEIGTEVHDATDQIFCFVDGHGRVMIDGHHLSVERNDMVVVPCGSLHNVVNSDAHEHLRFFTIYSPPAHAPGTVHARRDEAEADKPDTRRGDRY